MLALALAAALALNPAVTPDTLASTICRPGWAKAQRPSSAWVAKAAGPHVAGETVDHVLAISLGGAPRDRANLRRQTVALAKLKDADEARLHRAVCSGRMTLAAAQAALAALWP